MFVLITVMGLCVVALIAVGAYLELRPAAGALPGWARGGFALNQLLMFGSLVGLLILGIGDVLAQAPETAEASRDYSLGFGLAVIGVGLPTGLAAIASALALGPVGSAALAV
ncbi:MAG: ATPase, partial [Gammaproteobacteria bacterium]|nr:ATPase [Gammaproteobacteria bacterium]